jgi:hypothetical protein
MTPQAGHLAAESRSSSALSFLASQTIAKLRPAQVVRIPNV